MSEPNPSPRENRRQFLKSSTGAIVGGSLAASFAARSVHAAGSDVLKVGFIGCGGRGNGAAVNAITPRTMRCCHGGGFPGLEGQPRRLKKELGDKYAVDDDHAFAGFDAYKKVIDSGVDVVLLCDPPHFRPGTCGPPSKPASTCSARSPWPLIPRACAASWKPPK